MGKLEERITENGIDYILAGDYYIPDLRLQIITQYEQDMKELIKLLSQYFGERTNKMNIIYSEYNIHHNSIDIAAAVGYFLRIDCWEAEKGLKTTLCSESALNALAMMNH